MRTRYLGIDGSLAEWFDEPEPGGLHLVHIFTLDKAKNFSYRTKVAGSDPDLLPLEWFISRTMFIDNISFSNLDEGKHCDAVVVACRAALMKGGNR